MSKSCKYHDFFLILMIGLFLIIAIYSISNIYSKKFINSYRLINDLDTLNETVIRRFSSHGILYLRLSNDNRICLMCNQKNAFNEPVNLCEEVRIGDEIIYERKSRKLLIIKGISDSLIITSVK